MKNNSTRSFRSLEIILHVLFWIFLVGSNFMFWNYENSMMRQEDMMRCLGVPIILFISFYANYLFLAPHLLVQRNRINQYLLINVLLIVFCIFGAHLWFEFWGPPTGDKQFQEHILNKPRPPRWFFYIKDSVVLIVSVAMGATLRVSQNWWKEVQARQKAELAQQKAELLNLRNQINPHFLLNTLNNIYALIAFDSEKAQHAVHELSRLLRYVLYENSGHDVNLDKELDFLRNYVELMKLRLSTAVDVQFKVDIEKGSGLRVAPLLFISLVENAFKHGISSLGEGFVHVHFYRGDEPRSVICAITNSNYPKSAKDKSGSGVGLEQVQRRLDLLYPSCYSWEKGVSADGKVYYSLLTLKNCP